MPFRLPILLRGVGLAQVGDLSSSLTPEGRADSRLTLALAVRGAIDSACLWRTLNPALFWRHALTVGAIAAEVARQNGSARPASAFVAGLFHDLGKTVLDRLLAEAPLLPNQRCGGAETGLEVEHAATGVDHPRVGGWLAHRWGLPDGIRTAIEQHHHTDLSALAAPASYRALTTLVTAADRVAWALGIGTVPLARPLELSGDQTALLAAVDIEQICDTLAELLDLGAPLLGFAPASAASLRRALLRASIDGGHQLGEERRSRRQLEERLVRISNLRLASRRLQSAAEPRAVQEALLEILLRSFGFRRAAVLEWEVSRQELRVAAALAADTLPEPPPREILHFAPEGRLASLLSGSEHSPDLIDTAEDPQGQELARLLSARRLLLTPIVVRGEPLTLLAAEPQADGAANDPEQQATLRLVAEEATLALERARLYALTRELATHDELTGLLNHRQILTALADELERSLRYERPLAVIMCDLDGFKQFNDRFGHLAGDHLLGALARIVERSLRRSDLVGRYGGDEFLFLLPETAAEEARFIAGRVRAAVASYGTLHVNHFEGEQVTVSIGIAERREGQRSPTELVEAADRALYQAKSRGRNRVEIAEEPDSRRPVSLPSAS